MESLDRAVAKAMESAVRKRVTTPALIEFDGLEAHSSSEALDNDLERQNELLELGWQLRRWSGRAVRRRPREVAARTWRFSLPEP